MNPRIPALILTLCALTTPAHAARELESTRIMAVGEDQTIRLASGDNARFGDILFPDAALAAPWLATHLLQQDIEYRTIGEDRYGRTLIIAPDIEEAMLRDGIAVLYPQLPTRKKWQKAEEEAIAAKRGIWASPDFVIPVENAAQHKLQFHVIEGTVTRIHEGRSATYLNFGEHWQTDLSATITGRARRGFKNLLEHIGPGAIVRIRGVIYEENGPMIRLTRPEQLEIIKAAPPAQPSAEAASE